MNGSAGLTLADFEPRVVVLDCNVYLDIARLLGPPIDLNRLTNETWNHRNCTLTYSPCANGAQRRYLHDSLLLFGVLRTGVFTRLAHDGKVTDVPVHLYSSAHINDTTDRKLTASTTAPDPRDQGLGWTQDQADQYLDTLEDAIEATGGHTIIGPDRAEHSPPLDHEDGLVFNTAVIMNAQYLVTQDREFQAEDGVSGLSIYHSGQFLRLVRSTRQQSPVAVIHPDLGL